MKVGAYMSMAIIYFWSFTALYSWYVLISSGALSFMIPLPLLCRKYGRSEVPKATQYYHRRIPLILRQQTDGYLRVSNRVETVIYILSFWREIRAKFVRPVPTMQVEARLTENRYVAKRFI